jgi:hypothetical protein
MTPLPHEETTQLFAGKKGQRLVVVHRVFCLFKINEIAATDTLKGRATEISDIFVGTNPCFFAEGWMRTSAGILSADFHLRRPLDAVQPLVDISFCLKFLDDAEWSAKLIGHAFKDKGDTRAIMRERAVRQYEASILHDNPKAADNPQFQEMIKRMLETP